MRALLLALLLPAVASAYDRIVVVTAGVTTYDHGDPRPVCEKKGTFCHLPNARRDATAFADLMKQGRWLGPVEVLSLPANQTNKDGILKALRAAGRKAGSGKTLLLFYFTGHGVTHGDEGFIVPSDGHPGDPDSWIPVTMLRSLLKQPELGGVRHVLFILASCFSGTLLKSDPMPSEAELRMATAFDRRYIERVQGRLARVGITAGVDGDRIPDGPVNQGSEFGRALVHALSPAHGLPQMQADQNRDGCVTHLELAGFLHNKGRSDYNIPVLGTLDRDDQGTVLLCRLKVPAEPAPPPPPIENPKGPAPATVAAAIAPATAAPATAAPASAAPARPNPAGIEWVPLPGGTFRMGSATGSDDEKPVHQVTLSTFEMGRTEVTNAQWQACVAAGKCAKLDLVQCWDDRTKAQVEDPCPVVNVTWDEANTFAAWAAGRLPTEAEWEYAARSAGRDQAFPWGDEAATCARAVFDDGGNGCGKGDFAWAVCSKPAGNTAQGLCDMGGNAYEWTGDWYGPYEAKNQSNPSGPDSGQGRVVRGGSWVSVAGWVRAAFRDRWLPGYRVRYQGFRLVRRP